MTYLRRMADVVIDPDVRAVHWADFGNFDYSIRAGAEATERALPEIRQLLRHERVLSVLRQGSGRRMAEPHLQSEDMSICIE